MKIDISDLPLEKVIFAACENVFNKSNAIAAQKNIFANNVVPNSSLLLGAIAFLPTEQQIKLIIENSQYIDYIASIPLKLDLTNLNEVDFAEYDVIHETGKNDKLTSAELINKLRHDVCINTINELLPIYFQRECHLVELNNGGLAIRIKGLVDGMLVKNQLDKLGIQIDLFQTIVEDNEVLKQSSKEIIQVNLSKIDLLKFEDILRFTINATKLSGKSYTY